MLLRAQTATVRHPLSVWARYSSCDLFRRLLDQMLTAEFDPSGPKGVQTLWGSGQGRQSPAFSATSGVLVTGRTSVPSGRMTYMSKLFVS